jgi:hypothetical protein
MNYKALLITLFIVNCIFAAVHVLHPSKTIRGDYFYTIPHIIEEIPELQVRVFDATEQSISRLNSSSRINNGVALLINGIKTATLQDGFMVGDLKTIDNNSIDSIVVYTGVHSVSFAGEYTVIIDIITKKIDATKLEATVYTGSEVGDPTALLYIMDDELIPYNKEQLAAGELVGSIKAKRLSHLAGVNMVYMDRYSNGNEQLRQMQFGEKNSAVSMEEIRKGFYSLQRNRPNSQSAINFTITDYNLFRYDHMFKNYNYFEGTRGDLSITENFQADLLFGSISVGGMYEDGTFFDSEVDSINGDWGEFSLGSSIGVKTKNSYKYSLLVSGAEIIGEQPITKSDSSSYSIQSRNWSVSTKLEWPDGKYQFLISYPPSLLFICKLPLSSGVEIGIAATVSEKKDLLEKSSLYYSGELSMKKPVRKISSFYLGAGFEQSPHLSSNLQGTVFDGVEYLPWGEAAFSIDRFLKCSIYGSTYNISGRVGSEFDINGLRVKTGLFITSKSLWDNNTGSEISFIKPNDSQTTQLDARITAEIMITYNLFKDHLKMAIGARDIGKSRIDIPKGSIVGAVVVSNFSLQF